jgi:hypothetical protein
MKSRFLITESEKSQIKSLYGLDEGFFQDIINLFGDSLSKGEDSKKESDPDFKASSGDVDSNWMDVTKKVIDNFEGGYWNHWECKNHPYSSMYDKSGETMFGLDRKAGNIENLCSEGKEFFKLIDEEKKKMGMPSFCKKWSYNYKGGELGDKLKDLAAKIMKKSYDRNMSNFISDPEAKKRIENNKGLLLHMSYACWNGPGFFQDFAKTLQNGVKSGMSDDDLIELAKRQREKRLGGAWAQATSKVNKLIDQESNFA